MQGKVRQGTREAAGGDIQRDVARLLSKRGDAETLQALAKELIAGLGGTTRAPRKSKRNCETVPGTMERQK